MTHAQIVAALRNDVETHCDVYTRRNQFVRDTNAEPIRGLDRVGSRVHASGSEEAGSDGCSPTPTTPSTICECGHPTGDHRSNRSRSLTGTGHGYCLRDGCACLEFRACPCPVINGALVEQASCPVHGFGNHPALREVPGTGGRRHA